MRPTRLRLRLRLRLRTGLLVVAMLAIPLSFANNAIRRFRFCWRQQAQFAAIEQGAWTLAARPGNRAVHAEDAAIAYRQRKWIYRWEAIRFWEPAELIESEPYHR